MLEFKLLHENMTEEHLGIIPMFLSAFDPRTAVEQIDDAYAHGGGWRKFDGFAMQADGSIEYAGDPPYPVLAEAWLRDECIRYYDHSWVAIVQKDGSFEVARLD
jgi:hypothetical protein